ncbi:Uncharacterised protein [Clostridium putrefaciens]|uniref:Uncharacterized protein n=1 Tax=Clostridium putrefaciens TaxID=99675 RepID=A0A381J9X2_9CLOT|nr:hypothetical protein [Clostridium putrefaciens]SUY48064.1 Uncharacterised protein [Clostridium putrefaciens]
METIRFLIFIVSKILTFIFGVILIISPNRMLNYFVRKNLERSGNTDKKVDKNKLMKDTEKICKIGGVYCVIIILIDRFIRNSALAVIIGYFIIPPIGLYILEKRLNKGTFYNRSK